jgi:hypothetical protein
VNFYSCAALAQYLESSQGVLNQRFALAAFCVEATDEESAETTAYRHIALLHPEADELFVTVNTIKPQAIEQMVQSTGVAS